MPPLQIPSPHDRVVDPEKKANRERVDERNARIQQRGVPAPASGTFGRPGKVGENSRKES